MKPYFKNKYYVVEDLYIHHQGPYLREINKNKYYRIYNIHGSTTRYHILQGDEYEIEKSFHIDKRAFEKLFFTMKEIRKIKLSKINENNI